jgi:hypothetical protein
VATWLTRLKCESINARCAEKNRVVSSQKLRLRDHDWRCGIFSAPTRQDMNLFNVHINRRLRYWLNIEMPKMNNWALMYTWMTSSVAYSALLDGIFLASYVCMNDGDTSCLITLQLDNWAIIWFLVAKTYDSAHQITCYGAACLFWIIFWCRHLTILNEANYTFSVTWRSNE